MGKRDWDYEPVTIGTDEAAEGGVAVVRAESGAVAFVPRSVERLQGEGLELATQLQRLVIEIRDRQDELGELVQASREVGTSWGAIGWCVGTTAEAARQRWGGVS